MLHWNSLIKHCHRLVRLHFLQIETLICAALHVLEVHFSGPHECFLYAYILYSNVQYVLVRKLSQYNGLNLALSDGAGVAACYNQQYVVSLNVSLGQELYKSYYCTPYDNLALHAPTSGNVLSLLHARWPWHILRLPWMRLKVSL